MFQKSRKERRAARRLAGLAPHRRVSRPLYQPASSSSPTRAPGRSASRTRAQMWRSAYDMTPAEFEKETERLWQQVKPLYEQLHCYVRSQLAKQYGKDKVPARGIPSRRTCSATCGRRSGPTSTRWSSRTRGSRRSTCRRRSPARSRTPMKMVKIGEALLHLARPRSAAADASGSGRCSPSRGTARWSATPAPGTSPGATICASRCASSPRRRT